MKRHSLLVAPAVLILSASMNLHAESWFDSIKSFVSGEAEETSAAAVDAGKQSSEAITDAVKDVANNATDAVKKSGGEQMATTVGLVGSLTEQLGITPTQASAGLGALLGQAQGNLNTDQLSSLKSAIPNMDELIASVPALKEGESALGGMMGNAAGLMGNAEQAKGLIQGAGKTIQQFQAAGIDPSMISKFIAIIQGFLTKSGEPELAEEISSL